MPTRPSPRLARALVVTCVLLVSSGCLTVLAIDDEPYSEADGGSKDGGHDGGGNEQRDASMGDDGSVSGDGSSPPGDSSPPPSSWRLDPTFGDGGILTLPYDIAPGLNGALPIATAVGDAGLVYFGSTSTSVASPQLQITVVPPTGVPSPPQIVDAGGQMVALRVLPDGELAELGYFTPGSTNEVAVQVVDAGAVVQGAYAQRFVFAGGMATTLSPVAFLTVDGSTYTTAILIGPFTPALMVFDVAATAAPAPGNGGPLAVGGAAARAVPSGPYAWFTGGSDEQFERTPLDGGDSETVLLQCPAALSFSDVTDLDGQPVAVANTATGYEIRSLLTCNSLASASIAPLVPPVDGGGVAVNPASLARGSVGGVDSLAVVALDSQRAALYAGHLEVQLLDAGVVDGGDSVVLTHAPGDFNMLLANEIPGTVTVGPPALAGGFLYVPLGVTPPSDAGDAPMTMVILRLAYTPQQ